MSNKKGGLDQYGAEHLEVSPFDTTGFERVKAASSVHICSSIHCDRRHDSGYD